MSSNNRKRPAWQAGTEEDRVAPPSVPLRNELSDYYAMDERRLVGGLIERAVYTADERRRIGDIARNLVHMARANRHKHGGVDAFMHEYGLTSEEGII